MHDNDINGRASFRERVRVGFTLHLMWTAPSRRDDDIAYRDVAQNVPPETVEPTVGRDYSNMVNRGLDR